VLERAFRGELQAAIKARSSRKLLLASDMINRVMNFKVVLLQDEDGGYSVSCPALPGCHSQGDSMEEALENIKEAIAGCLESLAEERTKLLGASERIVEVTV
jgi:predicted RNase H-like HicB family nuclease